MADTASNSNAAENRQVPTCFAILLTIGCLFLFWPLLFQGHQLAYRDASYLYYPLFEFVQVIWMSGEIPLWNPQCGLGQPLLADGTPAVLYPGKSVFFLNFLPFTTRFGIYLTLHVMLGGVGAYRCGRALGLSQLAAAIAGLSFAFGAPFLSQVNNVVYLVGGAWLPWSILLLYQLPRANRKLKTSLLLAMCWAMMILGGDAQMVYHGLIISGILFFALFLHGHKLNPPDIDETPTKLERLSSNLKWLSWVGVASALAIALSAPQFFTTQKAMSESVRASFGNPRSVWEVPEYLTRTNQNGTRSAIDGMPENSDYLHPHQRDIYQFSLPPWTLIELAWPNISGTSYPYFRRWAEPALSSSDNHSFWLENRIDSRNWYPSLYMGTLTFLCALIGFRFRIRNRPECLPFYWLSWTCVFFALASFGAFGLWMWLDLIWTSSGTPPDSAPDFGSEVGGLYWLMTISLPKYALFRYPAKLFVVAALAICLLAGQGVDSIYKQVQLRRSLAIAISFIVISLLLFAATLLFNESIAGHLQQVPPDAVLGPFDWQGTLFEIRFALLFAAGIAMIGISFFHATSRSSTSRLTSLFLLCLFCSDPILGNKWIVATMPKLPSFTPNLLFKDSNHRFFEFDQLVPEQTEQAQFASPVRRIDDLPEHWIAEGSPDRLEEFALYRADTLQPKFHLMIGVRIVDSFSSIERCESYFILDNSHFSVDRYYQQAIKTLREHSPQRFSNEHQAWFAEGIRQGPQPDFRAGFDHDRFLNDYTDLIEQGIHTVHTGRLPDIPLNNSGSGSIKYVSGGANKTVFDVEATQASLMVCNDLYDDGWRARIRSRDSNRWQATAVYRTNHLMRGIVVPPGQHQVEFYYWPTRFVWGMAIAIVGWLIVAGCFAAMFFQSKQRKTESPAASTAQL